MKNLAIMFLVALALSTSFVFLNPTLAVTSDPQKQKAQTLLNALEYSNMSILQDFSRLEQQNITAQNAETTYAEGVTHANQAATFMNQENFAEACNEAVLAMQKFEETLLLLEDASPVEPTQAEVSAEEAINLKANITRTVEHLERLENLTQRVASAGYDTEAIEKKLTEIRRYLENATRALRNLNLEVATEQLCIAQTLLDEFSGYIDRLTAKVTASNTEKYLTAAEVRVSEAKQNITLSSLNASARDAAISALNKSETSLANARDQIEDNNVDEAIEDLEEAKKWEEESTRVINPTSVTANSTDAAKNSTPMTPTNDSITAANESETIADVTATK